MRIGEDVAIGADDETGSLASRRGLIAARLLETAEEFIERIVRRHAGNVRGSPATLHDGHVDHGRPESLDQRREVRQDAAAIFDVAGCHRQGGTLGRTLGGALHSGLRCTGSGRSGRIRSRSRSLRRAASKEQDSERGTGGASGNGTGRHGDRLFKQGGENGGSHPGFNIGLRHRRPHLLELVHCRPTRRRSRTPTTTSARQSRITGQLPTRA